MSKQYIPSRFLLSALVILLACAVPRLARATETTDIADGYTSTASAALSKKSFGTAVNLIVANKQNAYVQFSLESLPAGANNAAVSAATLKLFAGKVVKSGSLTVGVSSTYGAFTESMVTGTNPSSFVPDTNLGTVALVKTVDNNGYLTVDLTSYLHGLATLSSTSTVLTFVISQANPGDGTEVMFDSKENTTTSHAPSLDVTFGNGDIANITGHPFYSEVSGTSFEFVSTLAGYTLKAGEKIVLIGDVVLSATGATAFDVNFGYENDDSYYAPNPVSTATLQHISTTAAIQPESFTRTVIFTAPTDASYVIGMVVGNVSGSPVNSPSNTDVTIIPLQ